MNLKLVNQFGLCSDSATTSSPGSDGSNPSPHNNRAHTYIFMKTAVSSSPSACLAQLRWVQWKHVYIRPLPCSGHMHSFSSHHLPHATLAAYDYSRLNFSRGGGGGRERPPPPRFCTLCSAEDFSQLQARCYLRSSAAVPWSHFPSPPIFYPVPFLLGSAGLFIFLLNINFGAKKQLRGPVWVSW